MLNNMIKTGVDVIRLDFSIGDSQFHSETLQNLKTVLQSSKNGHVAVMMDTMGPIFTIGNMKESKQVEIKVGQELKIVTDLAVEGDETVVACTFEQLPQSVREGNVIYIDQRLLCEVIEVNDDHVMVVCKGNYILNDGMRICFPGLDVDIPTISERDEQDIAFVSQAEIDFLGVS
jgi:pyruvate kinase